MEPRIDSFKITGSRKHNERTLGAKDNARYTERYSKEAVRMYLVKVRNNMSTQSHKKITNTKKTRKEKEEIKEVNV